MQNNIKSLAEIIDQYDHYIFDMDGVLWVGNQLIECGILGVKQLLKHNKSVYFLTNNSTKSRETFYDQLIALDIETRIENVYSSSYLVAAYASANNLKKVYNMGMGGISTELQLLGIQVVESTDMQDNYQVTYDKFDEIQPDDDIDAVITGFNNMFNYRMLCFGAICVQAGAKLIAANPDRYIMVKGRVMPAGGSIQAIMENTCNQKATLVGKPSSNALELIMKQHNIQDKSRILMIGDNPETDIDFANQCGMDSLLVTTGVTSKDKAAAVNVKYICDTLWE